MRRYSHIQISTKFLVYTNILLKILKSNILFIKIHFHWRRLKKKQVDEDRSRQPAQSGPGPVYRGPWNIPGGGPPGPPGPMRREPEEDSTPS